jgi:hypothetical protein
VADGDAAPAPAFAGLAAAPALDVFIPAVLPPWTFAPARPASSPQAGATQASHPHNATARQR